MDPATRLVNVQDVMLVSVVNNFALTNLRYSEKTSNLYVKPAANLSKCIVSAIIAF